MPLTPAVPGQLQKGPLSTLAANSYYWPVLLPHVLFCCWSFPNLACCILCTLTAVWTTPVYILSHFTLWPWVKLGSQQPAGGGHSFPTTHSSLSRTGVGNSRGSQVAHCSLCLCIKASSPLRVSTSGQALWPFSSFSLTFFLVTSLP